MTALSQPLNLAHGPAWRNRIALAPLTNQQSNPDGTLNDADFTWLAARARGGFGLIMTAAAFVTDSAMAWPGQLGVAADRHLPGLAKLAEIIRAGGAVSSVQLHHGGLRCNPKVASGPIVAPFDDPDTGARALSTAEIEQVIADFVAGALRAQEAGFDGAEIHGAHGFLLSQFLDPNRNLRTDGYGGDYAGRTRIIREIVAAVRAATNPNFQLGIRLSPELNGAVLAETRQLAAELSPDVDYLDMSLWDTRKRPAEDPEGDLLIDHFAPLERGTTPLGVAGKITGTEDARWAMDRGVDFVMIGRGAITDHRFAEHALADAAYRAPQFPQARQQLRDEFVSEAFIDYFANRWQGMILD